MSQDHPPESPHQTPPGKGMGRGMLIGAWVLALGLLTLFFQDQIDEMVNPNQKVSSYTDNTLREVKLLRNRAGHYVATGSINGHAVNFLVDTGASDVAIPAHIAKKIGLQARGQQVYSTANGNVAGFWTVLDEVKLGDISLNEVRGGINPGMHGSQILLGMTFLKKLELIQRDSQLTLRQYLQ